MPVAARRDEFRVVKAGDVLSTLETLRRGLPYARLAEFEKRSGLPLDAISHVMRTPRRTLARRKSAGRLHPDESERLLRLSILFEKAVALFEGDVTAARNWLSTPKKAFAGGTPLDMAESEIGAREVEDLIGRLEHGVFS